MLSCTFDEEIYKKEGLSRRWTELYCKGDWESCIGYQMEERSELHLEASNLDGTLDEKLHKEVKK